MDVLRAWRDQRFMASSWGRRLVAFYYHLSSPIAYFIARNLRSRITRLLLAPLVKNLARKYQSN
ncbi:CFI-box-CTERM domain-containing protein [Simplicispira metamorpha]|uniref:CFI-box-CTERM domain-containing protein n=1 Tax=Simplicispira metamorpha TaxID=80881 RepID=UPI0035B5FECC